MSNFLSVGGFDGGERAKTKGCDVQGYGKGLKKRRWGGANPNIAVFTIRNIHLFERVQCKNKGLCREEEFVYPRGGVCRGQEKYRNRGKVVCFHFYCSVFPFLFYLFEIMF